MSNPLGQKIKSLRLRDPKNKITLDKLAEVAGTSKSYIWELENKDTIPRPSADKLAKIASALEVTVDFLLEGETTTPGEDVVDAAFFREYKKMPAETKEKIRKLLQIME